MSSSSSATDCRAAWRTGLYEPSRTAAVYDTVLRRAAGALRRGESVVLDASWADAAARDAALIVAARVGATAVALRCVAPPSVAAERIARRTGDPSDATPEIAARLAAEFAPWPSAARIDTTVPPADAVAAAVRSVERVVLARTRPGSGTNVPATAAQRP